MHVKKRVGALCKQFTASTKAALRFLSLCNSTAKTLKMTNIKTFIFFDMETTGLPHLEYGRTRMTELCCTSIQSEHISLGVFPRIQNKLSLCFNPQKRIDMEASKITGLTNELLEHQPTFNSHTFGILREFIELLPKPICFIAHNGKRFDYPILKAEIHKTGNELPEDILVVDSLEAFRALHLSGEETVAGDERSEAIKDVPIELQDGYDEMLCRLADELDEKSKPLLKPLSVSEIQKVNETTPEKFIATTSNAPVKNLKKAVKITGNRKVNRKLPFGNVSFKLGEIYQRLTFKDPMNAHKAECDVDMLIECAATLGSRFVDWCNNNAIPFTNIPMMIAGKKLGT